MARDFEAGDSDSYNVGNDSSLQITGTAITIATWGNKESNQSGGARIVSKRSTGGGGDVYSLYVANSDSTLRFRINDNDAVSTATIDTATLYHMAGVYDGTDQRTYIDGVLDGTPRAETGSINSSTIDVHISERHDESRHWDGILSHVAIWDVALTADEIASLARGTSPSMFRRNNLQGYWPLWKNGDGSDFSGNGNHGTAEGTGGPTAVDEIAPAGRYVLMPPAYRPQIALTVPPAVTFRPRATTVY